MRLKNILFYRNNKKHLENFTSNWPFYKNIEVLVPHFQNILSNHFLNYHINEVKYENIPKLCEKFNVEKYLINPIYSS